MVPLRFVAEALDADIQWDNKERKITILMHDNRIELWLDKEIAKVNGSPVALSVPAKQINGSTLVPVRFVSQNLKLKVAFNNQARTLTISGAGASDAPSSPAETDKLIALLKSGKTNSGRSLRKGRVYGDQFHISFQDYNEQTGEFGGKLEWMGTGEIDTLTGKADGNKLVMRQVSRHNPLYESMKEINGLITVSVTDVNHLSGTWSIPGSSLDGTIRFTIDPDDVSAFFHTYQVYVPSSSATPEKEEHYQTLTGVAALNGGLLIRNDGTYEWNSSVDGKVIKGQWMKTGDVDWPLKLLKGELGHDWSVAEAIHETGASIYLWDGTSTQNARLVKK